jgi:hypothetical protein
VFIAATAVHIHDGMRIGRVARDTPLVVGQTWRGPVRRAEIMEIEQRTHSPILRVDTHSSCAHVTQWMSEAEFRRYAIQNLMEPT